jgi:CubicO group peptidase (beta-lactamase class C family)
MEVGGRVAPGFERVGEVLQRSVSDRTELGASVCAHRLGELVVDLWAGWTDADRTTPWKRDTIVHAYSTVKPMVAACALILVDRGQLQLDAPVARWWPEFGAAGKSAVTVRQLLAHQAGLVAIRDDVPAADIFDWDAMIERLAAEAPWFEPRTQHGEHAYFYGHLVGELVRRADGRPVRRFFDEELAGPWGLDYQIGVRERDRGRVARLVGLETLYPGGVGGESGSVYRRGVTNPPGMLDPAVVNSNAWMDADVPAVNGFGTAAAVARFYQGFLGGGELDGRRLLSAELCREATSVQRSGWDVLLERPVAWGLGFQVEPDGSWGHGGLGGSGGYALPELDLAFGYVTNLMADGDRSDRLAEAVEECARRSA